MKITVSKVGKTNLSLAFGRNPSFGIFESHWRKLEQYNDTTGLQAFDLFLSTWRVPYTQHFIFLLEIKKQIGNQISELDVLIHFQLSTYLLLLLVKSIIMKKKRRRSHSAHKARGRNLTPCLHPVDFQKSTQCLYQTPDNSDPVIWTI